MKSSGKKQQNIKNNISNTYKNKKDSDFQDSEGCGKKKQIIERIGDWVCIKCKNLNFSFRSMCNRCELTKQESEKMFEQNMDNLINQLKFKEMQNNKNSSSQNNDYYKNLYNNQYNKFFPGNNRVTDQ